MSRRYEPQIESLERVIDTVLAVAAGAQTPGDVAQTLGVSDRQGRDYRDAAVVLGLLALDDRGSATVTGRAARLLAAKDQPQRTARLRHALRQMPAVAQALDYLQSHPLGCTVRKLEEVIGNDWPLGDVSVERRVQTIIAWLKEVELVSEQNGVIRPVDALAQR